MESGSTSPDKRSGRSQKWQQIWLEVCALVSIVLFFSLARVQAIRTAEEEQARAALRRAERTLVETAEVLQGLLDERTRRCERLQELRRENPLPLAPLHALEDELNWITGREGYDTHSPIAGYPTCSMLGFASEARYWKHWSNNGWRP